MGRGPSFGRGGRRGLGAAWQSKGSAPSSDSGGGLRRAGARHAAPPPQGALSRSLSRGRASSPGSAGSKAQSALQNFKQTFGRALCMRGLPHRRSLRHPCPPATLPHAAPHDALRDLARLSPPSSILAAPSAAPPLRPRPRGTAAGRPLASRCVLMAARPPACRGPSVKRAAAACRALQLRRQPHGPCLHLWPPAPHKSPRRLGRRAPTAQRCQRR